MGVEVRGMVQQLRTLAAFPLSHPKFPDHLKIISKRDKSVFKTFGITSLNVF